MNPNRQQLLDSISPNLKLTKALFLRTYGYEMSFPGFADEVIRALNDAGCSKAREYYDSFVLEYQRKRDEELRPVAKHIRNRWEEDWKKLQKRGEKNADRGKAQLSYGLPQDW